MGLYKLEIYFSEIVGIDNQYADGKIQEGINLINRLPLKEET